jgi:hypothetical protein
MSGRPANYAQWRKEQLLAIPPSVAQQLSAKAQGFGSEDYPGQAYFHANNPSIKRAEENAALKEQQVASLWLAMVRDISVKQRIIKHIENGPAREREALKRA